MPTKGSATISLRELNRATLARQMLLARDKVKPLAPDARAAGRELVRRYLAAFGPRA